MPNPWRAATNNSGAIRSSAPATQNAMSPLPLVQSVALANALAAFLAPVKVPAARNGDHAAVASQVASPGSNTLTWPRWRRAEMVAPIRSDLTDRAMTGPSHSKMAGTAKAVVLPQRVGPRTTTAPRSPRRDSARLRAHRGRWHARSARRSSVATRRPATRPRIIRFGVGPGTHSGALSRPRAKPPSGAGPHPLASLHAAPPPADQGRRADQRRDCDQQHGDRARPVG